MNEKKEQSNAQCVTLKGYVFINLIFWAFCAIQILVLKWMIRDLAGLYYFFGILAVSFTIVSIYDYVFDTIYEKRSLPKDSEKS